MVSEFFGQRNPAPTGTRAEPDYARLTHFADPKLALGPKPHRAEFFGLDVWQRGRIQPGGLPLRELGQPDWLGTGWFGDNHAHSVDLLRLSRNQPPVKSNAG